MNKLKKIIKDHKVATNAIGYGSLVIITLQIDPSTITHWYQLRECFYEVISNPYKCGLLLVATVGYFTNSRKQ